MARWRAFRERNGRWAAACSATHGESSKIHPRAAVNCSALMRLISSMVSMTEHGRAADPGFRDSFRVGEGENRAEEMPGARGVRGYRLKRASGWWFNVDEIGRFATLKIADLIFETDGLSPRASDQIKEV